MEKLKRFITSILPAMLLLTFLSGNANALLKAVGPLNIPSPPANGFPAWYQDFGALTLEGCLSTAVLPLAVGGGPACVLLADPGFVPTNPIVFPTNYPIETFYFVADAVDPGGVAGFKFKYRAAVEGSFAPVVTPGGQLVFSRIRVFADVPVAGTYTITHPYGVEVINAPVAGARAIAFTRDIGAAAFPTGVLAGDVGPFLKQVGFPVTITTPTGPETYIGNPNVPQPITGSPTGNNFVRIDGPIGSGIGGPGVDTLTISNLTVSGKVFPGSIASPLTIDRATYYRDATSAHIDTFVTALPTAIPIVSGTSLLTTAMVQDVPNTGKFWGHIHSGTPGLIPASVTITNNLDVPASTHVAPLVDLVTITEAMYNHTTKALTIKATSSDELAPLPVLTASSLPTPTALDATGTLVVPLPTTIPPQTVTVTSSRGGSATVPVTVKVAGLPPVAVADSALTVGTTPVVINVLANDTADPGTLDPTTVAIATAPLPAQGTATVNATTGAITFTPAAGASGTITFTYTVKDIFNQTSNAATVTVNIPTAAAAVLPPVAVNDTATTIANFPVTINVLANDTTAGFLNPSSVVIVTQPLNGTATVNAAGVVTFTPFGISTLARTFTYTVRDVLGQVSNTATVTVTVTPAVTPVAPSLVGPNGQIATATPVFAWNALPNAASYTLWNSNSGFTSFTAAAAGCPSGTGVCSATLATPLPAGTSVTWAVNATNIAGTGPFSPTSHVLFSVDVIPVAPTLVGPNGTVLTATPAFTWNAVSNATSYTLWNGNSGFTTYTAAAAGCPLGTGTCSVTLATPLPAGTTTPWAVRATNTAGTGPLSATMRVTF